MSTIEKLNKKKKNTEVKTKKVTKKAAGMCCTCVC